MAQRNTKKNIYVTLRQFVDNQGFKSMDGIRWIIRSDERFVKACVRKLGNRILIKQQAALSYIDSKIYTKDPKNMMKYKGRSKYTKIYTKDPKYTKITSKKTSIKYNKLRRIPVKSKLKKAGDKSLFEIVQEARAKFKKKKKQKQNQNTRVRKIKPEIEKEKVIKIARIIKSDEKNKYTNNFNNDNNIVRTNKPI